MSKTVGMREVVSEHVGKNIWVCTCWLSKATYKIIKNVGRKILSILVSVQCTYRGYIMI